MDVRLGQYKLAANESGGNINVVFGENAMHFMDGD